MKAKRLEAAEWLLRSLQASGYDEGCFDYQVVSGTGADSTCWRSVTTPSFTPSW
jgi:hypothetical protein